MELNNKKWLPLLLALLLALAMIPALAETEAEGSGRACGGARALLRAAGADLSGRHPL